MTAEPSSTGRPLARRVASQGALLMSGFALAHGFSFARNALIGHLLSPTDFGIAVTLTMMMLLLEALSDVGADRLLVQARDGNRPVLMANAHLLLIARGVLTALALYFSPVPSRASSPSRPLPQPLQPSPSRHSSAASCISIAAARSDASTTNQI